MDGLAQVLVAMAITFGVVVVLTPLALGYLLARQIAPVRPLRTMLIVLGCTLVGGPIGLVVGLGIAWVLQRRWRDGRGSGRAVATTPGVLGRPWAIMAMDAAAAGDRFCQVIATLEEGPLRSGLHDLVPEVDAAVAEARRLAEEGSRAQRSRRDIVRTLEAQRRAQRRPRSVTADRDESWERSIAAQRASAQRLDEIAQHHLVQLQLVVARLHELTAHALEVAAAGRPGDTEAITAVTDRVAALQAAKVEVEQVARGGRV